MVRRAQDIKEVLEHGLEAVQRLGATQGGHRRLGPQDQRCLGDDINDHLSQRVEGGLQFPLPGRRLDVGFGDNLCDKLAKYMNNLYKLCLSLVLIVFAGNEIAAPFDDQPVDFLDQRIFADT